MRWLLSRGHRRSSALASSGGGPQPGSSQGIPVRRAEYLHREWRLNTSIVSALAHTDVDETHRRKRRTRTGAGSRSTTSSRLFSKSSLSLPVSLDSLLRTRLGTGYSRFTPLANTWTTRMYPYCSSSLVYQAINPCVRSRSHAPDDERRLFRLLPLLHRRAGHHQLLVRHQFLVSGWTWTLMKGIAP